MRPSTDDVNCLSEATVTITVGAPPVAPSPAPAKVLASTRFTGPGLPVTLGLAGVLLVFGTGLVVTSRRRASADGDAR